MRLALDSTGANGTAGNYNYFTFIATSTNAPVFLQSAGAIPGVFSDDPAATVNLGAKCITIPKSASTRFYRLRSTVPTRLVNVQIVGANLLLTYE